MQIAALGRQQRLCGLNELLESSCSATESTSFSVETWWCASTIRQQIPPRARTSDDSAAGVQVLDDIHEAGHGLNQGNRRTKHCVAVPQPEAGDRAVAADDGIERTVETQEHDSELKRFLPSLEG